MKLIKASFLIKEQEENLEGVYKQIEWAGRHCYKSEDKITPDSAKEFVDRMIKSNHVAMLEHGTIYLKVNTEDINKGYCELDLFTDNNPYSRLILQSDYWYITTNLRVLLEHNLLGLLKYICEPTEFHEKRTSVRFICDIGITREFNRHRINSMAEQSTRYCNYTKDKFGNELTIIQPEEILDVEVIACKDDWRSKESNTNKEDDDIFRNMCNNISLEDNSSFNIIDTWLFANLACQWSYNRLIQLGWKPQQARRVLPLDLQTELVHTAFDSDWKHFFDLRDDSHAHPQAFELAHPLHEEFIKLGKCN